jgi:Mce-associated membrane protein
MARHADATKAKLTQADRPEPSPSVTQTDDGLVESLTRDEESAESVSAAPEGIQEDDVDNGDGQTDDGVDGDADDAAPARWRRSPVRLATVLALVLIVALTALAGWLGFQMHQSQQAQEQREVLVRVARQGAVNLTTIDWQQADSDVQRILDSATGTFYDDFSHRSKPFIDVVKKAQSKSVGTVTDAGLESQSGNEAQVLVTVSVNTSSLAGAEPDPRHWRMRITVQKAGNDVKVSKVAFVP